MRYDITYLAISVLVFIAGCGEPQPIPQSELPGFTPKLVINSSIDNNSLIEVKVSNNTSAYNDSLPETLSDVNVILKAAGSELTMTYDPISRSFKTNRRGEPGRLYTVEVQDKKGELPTAFSSARMPELVLDKSVGFIEGGGTDMNGNSSDLISISWQDVFGKNYYLVYFYYYSQNADLFIPFEFELTDPTLKAPETIRTDDGGYIFDDALFNGQKKTLSVVPPAGLVATNTDIRYLVELRTLSTDYYKYFTTLQRYRDNSTTQQAGPFGSAVIVHSNIQNGLGAFLTSTFESDTIR